MEIVNMRIRLTIEVVNHGWASLSVPSNDYLRKLAPDRFAWYSKARSDIVGSESGWTLIDGLAVVTIVCGICLFKAYSVFSKELAQFN
jgi:hypothetical protein